jgi:hypothetical protein
MRHAATERATGQPTVSSLPSERVHAYTMRHAATERAARQPTVSSSLPPPGIATTDRDRLRAALNSNFTSSSVVGACHVVCIDAFRETH